MFFFSIQFNLGHTKRSQLKKGCEGNLRAKNHL